ncbi:MAG TPA: hypothetical protein VN766_17020 [Stellaceae bacterium]|nr:hypothetical protein [Stellaceae bacterium]
MVVAGTPNPTLDLYCALMEEVKLRILSIDTIMLNGAALKLPGAIAQEFGFLQVRLACEVIALACLVAHGDIKAAQAPKVMKEWAADKIMAELDRLHPRFFPRPITATRTPQGQLHIQERRAEVLTKEEFTKLYARCGGFLHRGSAKKLLAARQPIQIQFPELAKWRDKMLALLDTHHILSLDGQHHILCNIAPFGEPVTAAFATTPL